MRELLTVMIKCLSQLYKVQVCGDGCTVVPVGGFGLVQVCCGRQQGFEFSASGMKLLWKFWSVWSDGRRVKGPLERAVEGELWR